MEPGEVGGITTTEVCNISCVMCHFNGPQALRKQGTLTPEEVRKYLSSIPQGPVGFSSTGDFFMDPNWRAHLRAAIEYGHTPRIQTNGQLLTPGIIDEILDIGVRHISISVDAFEPDQYRKIRRGGELSVIVDACLYLRAQKRRYPDVFVEINNVLFRKTFPLQDKFVDFWRGKVDQVNFNAEYYDTFKFRNTFYDKGERCDCQMRAFLLPNGQLSPCCAIIVHQHVNNLEWLPHIRDTTPAEAIDRFKTLYAEPSSPLGQLCQQCDWWILFKRNELGDSPYLRSVPLGDDGIVPLRDEDLIEVEDVLRLADVRSCNNAQLVGAGPIAITTAPERWSYAAALPIRLGDNAAVQSARLVIRVDVTIEAGRVGIGVVNQAMDAFVGKETPLFEPGQHTAEITVTDSRRGQWLIIRNTNVGPSRVTVNAVRTFVVPPPAEAGASERDPAAFVPLDSLRPRS